MREHLSAPWVFMEGEKQADELQMENEVNNATSHLVGEGQFGSGGKNSIHRSTGLFSFCYSMNCSQSKQRLAEKTIKWQFRTEH